MVEQEQLAKKQISFQKEAILFRLDFGAHHPVVMHADDAAFEKDLASPEGGSSCKGELVWNGGWRVECERSSGTLSRSLGLRDL